MDEQSNRAIWLILNILHKINCVYLVRSSWLEFWWINELFHFHNIFLANIHYIFFSFFFSLTTQNDNIDYIKISFTGLFTNEKEKSLQWNRKRVFFLWKSIVRSKMNKLLWLGKHPRMDPCSVYINEKKNE